MFEKLRTIAGTAVMSPLRAMRREYLPILTVYFAYGLSGVTSIAETFWQKEETTLTAEQLISIRLWLVVPWTAKVLVGQCVDSIPLFGSGRRAYIVLGAGLSFVGGSSLCRAGQPFVMADLPWIRLSDLPRFSHRFDIRLHDPGCRSRHTDI